MKILFYTDAHNSGVSPKNRNDDFPNAIVNKIADCYALAKEERCDFVIFGGDMCNTHKIFSFDIIGKLIDIIHNSGTTTYAAIGQHDLDSYNPNSYSKSTLGFIERISKGMFKSIGRNVVVGDVCIWASHVWEDPFDANKFDTEPYTYNILVAHHLLTNRKDLKFNVINTGEFASPQKFDLVLSGDLHEGYEIHKIGKTTFCNPGSLARRATSDSYRMPRVAIVEISDGKTEISYVNLKSGRIGSEVFNLDVIEEKKAMKERTVAEVSAMKFSTLVKEFESVSENIHDIVRKVGLSMGTDPKILAYLDRKRLQLEEEKEKST